MYSCNANQTPPITISFLFLLFSQCLRVLTGHFLFLQFQCLRFPKVMQLLTTFSSIALILFKILLSIYIQLLQRLTLLPRKGFQTPSPLSFPAENNTRTFRLHNREFTRPNVILKATIITRGAYKVLMPTVPRENLIIWRGAS